MAANLKGVGRGRGRCDSGDKGWGGRGQTVETLPTSVAASDRFPISDLSSPRVGGCAGEEPGRVPTGIRGA